MGCDIHLFIEYKQDGQSLLGWWAFGGEHRLDRDYRLFARMAGVRNYWDAVPISNPRDLPDDASWQVKDKNRLLIVDNEEAGEREATREQAERWVKSGSSKYDGDRYVTHPDWHSHSWLSADEFEACLNSFESVSAEYKAVLAALRCFESDVQVTRVVFWFDN